MLTNIQALRALAALVVVVYHALTAKVFGVGRFGVDIFFVISGFIMVHTTSEGTAPQQFFTKRLIRIVPLYWTLTLAVFVVAMVMPRLLKATEADPVQLVKSLFFIPFMKSNGQIHPVLFLGWTLNYEMFFYALFAVGLLFRRRIVTVAVTSAAIAALVALGMAADGGVPFTFYTNAIMLEFIAGMLLALAAPRIGLGLVPAMALIALGLGGAALVEPYVTMENRGFLWLPFALLIVAAAVAAENRGHATHSRAILLLGAASYSLYLVHPYVLAVAEKLPVPGKLAIGVAGAVAAALVTYYTIEKPANRYLRARIGSGRIKSLQAKEPALAAPVER